MHSFTTCTNPTASVLPITILGSATKSWEILNMLSNTMKKASLTCHQQKHSMLQDMPTTVLSKRPKTRRPWILLKHTIKNLYKQSRNTRLPFSTWACSNLRHKTSKNQFLTSTDAVTQFAVANTDSLKHITKATTVLLLMKLSLRLIKTNKR